MITKVSKLLLFCCLFLFFAHPSLAKLSNIYIEPSRSLVDAQVDVPAGSHVYYERSETAGNKLVTKFKVQGGADTSVAGNTVLPILIPASLTARTEAKRPDRLLSEATTKIIELLKNNRDLYAKDHDKLYAMAYEHIVSLFDFRIIAKLILNEHWRQASEGQRTQFATEFRDRLVRTYATALLKYQDEQFVFLPFNAKPEDKRVIVKTEFKRGDGGPNIAVNYRLYNGKSGWKVYDVMVMGMSLVTMHRRVYAVKIKNEGIDAVIDSLAHVDKQASQ